MIGKIHITDGRQIFACCDKSLLDKSLKFNDADIIISSSFFGKDKITKEQLIENIKNCDCANIFGNDICNFLIEKKLIIKEQVIMIDGVAHAQVYKL